MIEQETVKAVISKIYEVVSILSKIDTRFDGIAHLPLRTDKTFPEEITVVIEQENGGWLGSYNEYLSFPAKYLSMSEEDIISEHKLRRTQL